MQMPQRRESLRVVTALSLALFMLALLSNSAVVALPPVLLVLYWWKRGRITLPEIGWLIPFFGVAISLGLDHRMG